MTADYPVDVSLPPGGGWAGGIDPEQQALELRVAAVEAALVDLEVEVETLRVEIDNFARLHHERLGPLYVHLDELEALIAEAVAARTGDPADIRRAYERRSVVTPLPDLDELFGGPAGADTGQGVPEPQPEAPRRVRPGKEAQRLYRDLARRAHPDLTTDPAEQRRRSSFIARVNEAYARGDESALHALAEEWAAVPSSTAGPAGVPDRADWLRQRLAWLVARIERAAEQQVELESSPMGRLLKLSPEEPDRLLEDIAEQLLAKMEQQQAELDRLLAG